MFRGEDTIQAKAASRNLAAWLVLQANALTQNKWGR